MKKTFPLHLPGKADARVLDGIKSDIRRYVKRERRKPVPAGVDFWDVNCAVGPDQAHAVPKLLTEVSQAIDEIATAGTESVYIEILAKPRVHQPSKPPSPPTPA